MRKSPNRTLYHSPCEMYNSFFVFSVFFNDPRTSSKEPPTHLGFDFKFNATFGDCCFGTQIYFTDFGFTTYDDFCLELCEFESNLLEFDTCDFLGSSASDKESFLQTNHKNTKYHRTR
ncbi:hypothetical protein Lser_V15G09114 [Lactuca serriola]